MMISPQVAYQYSKYVEAHQRQVRYAPRFPLLYGGHRVMRLVFDPRDLFAGNHCGYVVTIDNRVMRFSAASRFERLAAHCEDYL